MSRMEIIVEGFDRRGTRVGKATRILNRAKSKDFVLDNVEQVRGSIRVGMAGKHVIKLKDDKGNVMERIDTARRGACPAERGTFTRIS